MAQGYRNRPDLEAAAFRDGWYLSGDLGRIDVSNAPLPPAVFAKPGSFGIAIQGRSIYTTPGYPHRYEGLPIH
jgi:hypothetical protein